MIRKHHQQAQGTGSTLPEKFRERLKELGITGAPMRILLAVSGGADSVVLCELCHLANIDFGIAHVNFGLRANESDGDEAFVRGLAAKYNRPFYTVRADTENLAKAEKTSIQVAARNFRYTWLEEIRRAGYHRMFTAHHLDDNLETVVMNFFRGTGIRGLAGMLPVRDLIVRPLLPFSKQELLAFAGDRQLTFREDSSNLSDKYTRNYFRNRIIPMAMAVFPEAEKNILANMERMQDAELLYRQAVALHRKSLLEKKGKEWHIPILKLKKTEPLRTVLFELARPFDFTAAQLPDILSLLNADQGKYVQSPTHRIIRNRSWLVIAHNEPAKTEHIVIDQHERNIIFDGGEMELEVYDAPYVSADPSMACLDHKMLQFPLVLRKWRAGDYFYPLGLNKKKKVSRFLIDRKLSPTEKGNTWIIESGKRICWVVGHRIDERFRVTPATGKMLEIRLKSAQVS